jgi:hypothetical protein
MQILTLTMKDIDMSENTQNTTEPSHIVWFAPDR